MRRKERAMQPDSAWQLLRDAEYGVLCLVDEDAPYGVPVSFALIGETLYIHGAIEGRRPDCIRRNSKACFTVIGKTEVSSTDFTTAYESVIAEGEIFILRDTAEIDKGFLALAQKYNPHMMEQVRDYQGRYAERVLVCRMDIKRISGKANRR